MANAGKVMNCDAAAGMRLAMWLGLCFSVHARFSLVIVVIVVSVASPHTSVSQGLSTLVRHLGRGLVWPLGEMWDGIPPL